MDETTNYPDGITPELLMAYADGALEAEDRLRVEAALAAHPGLAEEVAAYQLTRDAVGGAFDAPMQEEVPAHLEALVLGSAGETSDAQTGGEVISLGRARERRGWLSASWPQAIAAAAAFAFGSVFGAAVLGGTATGPSGEDTLLMAGKLSSDHPIAVALESTPSGQLVNVDGGQFDAIATFATAGGAYCREFEAAAASSAVVGIACREAPGWRVEVLLAAEPAADPQAGFQLASGFDDVALSAVLDRLGVEAGLNATDEACLLENGFDASLACE